MRARSSLLAVDVQQAGWNQIGPLVVAHIQSELGAEGQPIDTLGRLDPTNVGLAKTAGRSVLGCMNDMAFISNYVVGEAGGLANCDIPNLNRQLRRNINSSRGYARPHRLAAGWFRSSSRTLIETSLPSSYQRATYLDPGPVGTAALRAPP
jgi:hypothetical protein